MGAMLPMDRETTLLDLLGGWLEFVEECFELGQRPRDEFEAEYFEDEEADPDTYDAWRQHYSEDYLETVRQLHQDAQDLVLPGSAGTADLTPAEFLIDEVAPLLLLRGESPASR